MQTENHRLLRLPSAPLPRPELVMFDLDGTLLDQNASLSQPALDSLQRLSRAGIPYTIASGRAPAMLRLFCRRAGIRLPVIGLEGAVLYDIEQDRALWQRAIPASVSDRVIRFLLQRRMDFTVYTDFVAFLPDYTRRLPRLEGYNAQAGAAGTAGITWSLIGPQYQTGLRHVLKLYICEGDPADRQAMFALISGCRSVLRSTSSEGDSVSLVARGISKCSALGRLCVFLGCGPAQVCAFGNYYNDLEMLRFCGYGVAMGDAPESVRRAARYVTLPNTEDGVAFFIHRYLLSEGEERK